MARRRRWGRAVTLVEFSIVAPVVLVVVFGIVDFSRAVNAQSTIADAARQGTRQATANADSSPNPFTGYANQSCSGTAQTYNVANNAGCLSDAAVLKTIQRDMGSVAPAANITQQASCASNPAIGHAIVCITPPDVCSPACAPAQASCPAGTLPVAGTLGDRQTEWTSSNGLPHNGCFVVQVTIVYTYQPLTPLVGSLLGGGIVERSTTAIVAEY